MNRFLFSVAGLTLAAATPVFIAGCHSSTPAATEQSASSAPAAASTARVTAAQPVRRHSGERAPNRARSRHSSTRRSSPSCPPTSKSSMRTSATA